MRVRVAGVVVLLLAGLVLAACGDSGGSAPPATVTVAATAATDTAISLAVPPVLDDPSAQTLCDTLFAAWQAGNRDQLGLLASKAAGAALSGHSPAGAGLRASGQDCLLIETAPKTDGELAAVGDVKMGLADGSPQALDVTWTDAAGLDADQELAKRVEATPIAVRPGAAQGTGTAAAQANPSDADDAQLALGCVARSDKAACTELGTRIAGDLTDAERTQLLCTFSAPVVALRGTPTEFAFLERVLGADAPSGVVDAVHELRDGSGDPTAAAARLSGYVGRRCAG